MKKRKKSVIHPRANFFMSFVFMGIILVGLILSLALMGQRQELRKRAAGAVQSAQVLLDTGVARSFTPGSPVTINVTAKDSIQHPIDGIQLIFGFSGTVPSNLQFAAKPIPGFRIITNSWETTAKRRQFTLVYITETPTLPVLLTKLELGQFTFTAPPSGSMTVSFGANDALITQYQVSANILQAPGSYKYTFTVPTPTPAPTATPTPPKGKIIPALRCNTTGVKCPGGGTQVLMNGRCTCPPANPAQ